MPQFPNSSHAQEFLGTHLNHDLYWDSQGGSLPTVIARYGPDGPEYKSGLMLADQDLHLKEARRLARLRGFDVEMPQSSLNLYVLSQKESKLGDGHCIFAIVIASSEQKAKNIHPTEHLEHGSDNAWKATCWASSPDNVTAELIGTAPPGSIPGLVTTDSCLEMVRFL